MTGNFVPIGEFGAKFFKRREPPSRKDRRVEWTFADGSKKQVASCEREEDVAPRKALAESPEAVQAGIRLHAWDPAIPSGIVRLERGQDACRLRH